MATPPVGWTNKGTTLVYNNIVLANCELKQFSQNVVYAHGDADALHTTYVVSVSAWIHDQQLEGMGLYVGSAGRDGLDPPVVNHPIAVNIENEIQKWLLTPRLDLKLSVEGNVILEAKGPEDLNGSILFSDDPDYDLYDVNNGPKPQSCSVTYVAGYKAFHINYTIQADIIKENKDLADRRTTGDETWKDPIDPATSKHSIISNKWSISEVRDSDFLITRTLSGVMKVNSNRDYPLAVRTACVPAQLRGYQRMKLSFLQSPDGLTLTYTITDKQQYAAPLRPAIDWRATHTENVENQGQTGYARIDIWVRGAIGTPKWQLLNGALEIARQRLKYDLIADNEAAGDSVAFPISQQITDHMHKPELEVSITIRRTMQGGPRQWGNMIYDSIGKLPAVNAVVPDEGGTETPLNDAPRDDQGTRNQYNRDKWPTVIPYDGTTPAGMFISFLQRPAYSLHSVPTDEPIVLSSEFNEWNGADTRPDTDPEIEVFEGEDVGEVPSYDAGGQVSQEHKNYHYSHYELESKYVVSGGVQALPIASVPSLPTDQTAFIGRIAHPITYRDVWVKAKRVGERPRLPEVGDILTDINGIVETLVESTIVPVAPVLMMNGYSYEWEVEAFYRYALSRTPTTQEKLRTGSIPWTTTEKQANEFVVADNQSNTII